MKMNTNEAPSGAVGGATAEIIKKVRKIEIKTRGLSNNIFAGQYHTAFKEQSLCFYAAIVDRTCELQL